MHLTGDPRADLFLLYGFHFHVFVSLLAIMGMIMLHQWALRNLPPEKLKRTALWMFWLGAAGVALTVPFCIVGMRLIGSM